MINFFKFLSLSLLALVYTNKCSAQATALKQITGLRSTEVYDLLTDSKGFLWIAHDAGISKYDGISFTNFSNPQQASLATTNLLEDKLGRIWFINFTGQIFYIENGHMTLLKAYKSEAERVFPRMGLLDNLLIATSKKGLFICDINTLQCHYENCIGAPNRSTSSLCILKDKVLLYGSGYWFIYQPHVGLKTAVLKGDDGQISNSLTLSRSSYKDTSLMFRNPSNTFYKLWVSSDTVKVCEAKRFDSFINTVSIVNNKYWINSINSSLPNDSKSKLIKGYNISCIAADKEGHYWYGSLQHGLLTDSLRSDTLQSDCMLHLGKDDLIKCMVKKGENLFLGTQSGMLISYNTITNRSTLLTTLPASDGGITYLKLLNNERILIGSPVYTYIFRLKGHCLKSIDLVTSLKQAEQIDGALLMASSNNMIVLPDKDDQLTFDIFKKKFKGLADKKYTMFGNNARFLSFTKRSRAICYSSASQTIWVSTKDGLYRINNSGISPFYLNNLPMYASCLTTYANLVIVGTFNNGIKIIDGNNVKSLTSDDGLLSNDIVNIKVINKNLWVYTSGSIQIFSLETFKLTYKYPFPTTNNVFLTNADELNNNCYFTVLNGLYKITPVQKKGDTIGIYLNSLFINHKDTSTVNNLKLPYFRNDIQLSLGTPYLFDAKDIVIKYRLENNDSTKWLYARPGERNFHFASLMPGDYQFEASAIKPQSGLSSRPFIMNFTIRQPWWQTWWFESLETIGFLFIVVGVLRYYYVNKLNRQKLQFEKELIAEKERQHISREIHDHIGQALSVIKLNLNMNSQIDDTKELVSEVMDDLRQFTHGLYHGKLLKGSLSDTIKKDVERLNISDQLVASLDVSETTDTINPEYQLLIYRIFQEAISNILKHANAKNIFVQMISDKKHFKLTIVDDGIGFSDEGQGKGLGLDSMRRRAKLLKGKLTIVSKPHEGCKIELIISHVQKL
ncbi:sensor histidine kinase [Mucilaginibacter ginsenosidivorans]|uniref:histidine kinase n=2 Tax=Mucilaginibacter ginsenosidivorans TaxID=398053 RepID=A0A5B8V162_9SPHI|nr:ATP-binding protein [Mucilaginibacter ginsenosidivorans]QEC65104.1 sensor histidine kinase [Mucilaginibacter ginsenosidivorans]